MGLLDKKLGNGGTPTHQQQIEMQYSQIRNMSKVLYNLMFEKHGLIFREIWNCPTVSPQEIMDMYGTDAVLLFLFSSQIQNLLASSNPNYVPLAPPYQYTINPDGTVTIGDPIQLQL